MSFAINALKVYAQLGGVSAGTFRAMASYATNDTLATVQAASYFNGAVNMLPAGSIIEVAADMDGTPTTATLLVSANDGTTVTVVPAGGASGGLVQALSSDSTVALAHGIVELGASTAYTIGDPIPGCDVTIAFTAGTTVGATVTPSSSLVTFNYAGNTTLTLDADDELVVLRPVSTTQFAIISNVGSVGAS